ncbi:MAG TPA: hypothetical protein VOA87_20005 [Thermoanaerobaculia bacterium]|nr:hypothetical protein [Thermoanaerobaculia bacterium]
MSRTIQRRAPVALALAALLTAAALLPPPVQAARRPAPVTTAARFDLLHAIHRAWGWIAGLWADATSDSGGDAGGMLDPNGKWSTNPPPGPIG